jgi:hypothetical protein
VHNLKYHMMFFVMDYLIRAFFFLDRDDEMAQQCGLLSLMYSVYISFFYLNYFTLGFLLRKHKAMVPLYGLCFLLLFTGIFIVLTRWYVEGFYPNFDFALVAMFKNALMGGLVVLFWSSGFCVVELWRRTELAKAKLAEQYKRSIALHELESQKIHYINTALQAIAQGHHTPTFNTPEQILELSSRIRSVLWTEDKNTEELEELKSQLAKWLKVANNGEENKT